MTSKDETANEIALQIFNSHSIKKVKDIARELEKLVNLTAVRVYHAGELAEKDKAKIAEWLGDKVQGEYSIDYIEDPSLIAGFKIIYRDYVYDATVLNSFNQEVWKNQKK